MELKDKQWNIYARPTKLSDVYGGSSSIIDTMIKPFVKDHAKSNQWPRGTLLVGKSGGGKTTIAKIIAMTMVCKHLDAESNPCGECPDCKAIIEEKWNRDVKLVDATSLKADGQSSVEGMQKLVQDSRAMPFFGKRKVIIVDEIQELFRGQMKASVNTLLKELERNEGKTCWIFTSMDDIKATGSTVETELGNGSGYGSSGQSGFLRRVTQFKFAPLAVSDLMKYAYDFAHKHTYDGKLLWEWMLENGGKEFCTEGLKLLAEGSVGSIGFITKNLQTCVDSRMFDLPTISKFVNISPEVQILEAVVAIATNDKSDQAFMQLSRIDASNFSTVYQIMMSEIRRAEMLRVFNRLGNVKTTKDGKEELRVVDESTTGPEKISFNRAKIILEGKNYTKLKNTLVELNQEGFFTVDLFKVKLLSVFD